MVDFAVLDWLPIYPGDVKCSPLSCPATVPSRCFGVGVVRLDSSVSEKPRRKTRARTWRGDRKRIPGLRLVIRNHPLLSGVVPLHPYQGALQGCCTKTHAERERL